MRAVLVDENTDELVLSFFCFSRRRISVPAGKEREPMLMLYALLLRTLA